MGTARPADVPMSRSLSIYLDLLRFAAAMAVFGGHLVTHAHLIGYLNETVQIQNDAVVWFFVLSGTVIGYVSEQKEPGLGVFLRARLARLWSVAIPALLLTPVLDAIGGAVDPSAYLFILPSLTQTLHDMVVSALFLNNVHTWSVIPGSNLPYWSLSYEFAYYLLFGLAFYLRGWIRPIATAIAALLIGHRILLLLPIWLFGLGVWHARTRMPAWSGWPLFGGSILAYVVLANSGIGLDFGRFVDATLLHDRWLGWSQLAGWKYLLGLLVAANILGFATLSGRVTFGRGAPLIRAAAGTTFTLYLFHYPLLNFFGAVAPGPPPGLLRCLEIGVLTLLCVVGIAALTERQKDRWRRQLDRICAGSARLYARAASSG
jgi:peptidoglycan/LPS O-acetylase OafA/YrhL